MIFHKPSIWIFFKSACCFFHHILSLRIQCLLYLKNANTLILKSIPNCIIISTLQLLHLLTISHGVGFPCTLYNFYLWVSLWESLSLGVSSCAILVIILDCGTFYSFLFLSYTTSTCSESVFTLVSQLGVSTVQTQSVIPKEKRVRFNEFKPCLRLKGDISH